MQYAKITHTFGQLCSACRISHQNLPKMLYKNVIYLMHHLSGVALSIGGFFKTFVEYANHDVGFWSILTGVLAGICFHLHWVVAKGTLNRWHTRITLRNLNVVGFLSAVAGITALIWYTFLTFYYNIPMEPISKNKALAAFWALFTSYWAMYLTYYSHKLEVAIEEGSGPILTENNE